MKLKFLRYNILRLVFLRKRLFSLVGLLALSNVLLGIALLCRSEKMVLVPPEIRKPFALQSGKASKEYLEEMGWYLSKLLLDLSPASVSHNHAILLTYVAPESYGPIKNQLLKDGEEYSNLQLATHFKPSEISSDPQTLEVTIKGILSSFVAMKHVGDSQETITIKFTQRGAGLLIESISGGKPYEA